MDVVGAGAPSPHWRMASSVVPVLYALQGSKIHGVVSMDCKAKPPEDLELSYRVDEVVAYSRWVIKLWGIWKSLNALHICLPDVSTGITVTARSLSTRLDHAEQTIKSKLLDGR